MYGAFILIWLNKAGKSDWDVLVWMLTSGLPVALLVCTYILTYIHTYLLTYSLTYIHTYLLTYLLTYLQAASKEPDGHKVSKRVSE